MFLDCVHAWCPGRSGESVGSPGTRIADSCELLFVCWELSGLVGRNSQCLPTELSLQLCLGTFIPVQTLGSEYAEPAARLEEASRQRRARPEYCCCV